MLLAQNGTHLDSAADKLERWWKKFVQVSDVSVEIDERVLSSVLETNPASPPLATTNNYLSSVPCEDEISPNLKMMKNGQTHDADPICTELLKLRGENVMQWLVDLAQIVWEKEKVLEDWVKQLTFPLHKMRLLHDCDNIRSIVFQCARESVL